MIHLHQNPKAVHRGLSAIAKTTLAFLEAAMETGIDGIFFATQHATYRYFDDEGYLEFGQKYDLQVLEGIDGLWLNLLHLHGEAIMFDVASAYPTNVVNWHDQETQPDLATAQGLVEGAVCGGLHRRSLVLDTPDMIQAKARDALNAPDGKGFILGTGCVVPIKVPPGNLRAVRNAVEFA